MATTILLLDGRTIGGVSYADGDPVSVSDELADELVGAGIATYQDGNRTGWINVPSVFRLRLTGTGNCILDSRDRLGEISLAVASFSASAATNQIEFPYAGDAAVEIRLRLSGTCQAEVI